MKTTDTKSKNGSKAQVALAELNEKIQSLQQQRAGLSEPLKLRFGELRSELLELENQILEFDPAWKSAPLKPKADDKIREILTANGGPMTEADILTAIGNTLTKWKVKNVLRKRSTGPKAVFTLVDGKYSVKAV